MFRSRTSLPTAVLALATAAAIAGCGTASHHSSGLGAGVGANPTSAQMLADGTRFASCMHAHHVPTFPDPGTNPREFKQALDPSVNHGPAFAAALRACQHILPAESGSAPTPAKTHQQVLAALAFARCLRAHGFPQFPDPTSGGQLSHQMVAAAGINVHQPAVKQAADACAPVTHGLITPAIVARFVAGH